MDRRHWASSAAASAVAAAAMRRNGSAPVVRLGLALNQDLQHHQPRFPGSVALRQGLSAGQGLVELEAGPIVPPEIAETQAGQCPGYHVAQIPSLLGGAGSFLIGVEAASISDAVGPILGQLDYWDTQDRFRPETFFDSIRMIASGRSAFTPKIRFKSLTVNGQIVRGRWSIVAGP